MSRASRYRLFMVRWGLLLAIFIGVRDHHPIMVVICAAAFACTFGWSALDEGSNPRTPMAHKRAA